MRVAERVRSWAKRFSFKDNPLADVAEEEPVTPQLQHGATCTYTTKPVPTSISSQQSQPQICLSKAVGTRAIPLVLLSRAIFTSQDTIC